MRYVFVFLSIFIIISFATAYALENDTSTNVHIGIESGKLTVVEKPDIKNPVIIKDIKSIPKKIIFSLNSPLIIQDYRGLSEGWKLSVTATPFEEVTPSNGFSNGTKPIVFPKGSLSLSFPQEITNDSNRLLPMIKMDQKWIIDEGIPVTILKTDDKNSSGSYQVTFPKNAINFYVQPNTTKEDTVNYPHQATAYRSYVTWSIIAGP